MEQAAVIAIGLFMIGVVYWSGWLSRGVAEHERRITDVERNYAAILSTLGRLERIARGEDGA